MWSIGYSRMCCDVYPANFIAGSRKTFFERGDPDDEHYFYKKRIKNGDIVYVVTSDLPGFIRDVFLKLSMSTKIVLVTGSEDIGAPYEVFHPNRPNFFDYKETALWPRGRPVSMRDFLADPRLSVWFAQNWDLDGCNMYTCSSLSPADQRLLPKVVPLPIGLDLHSFGEKKTGESGKAAALVCQQLELLQAERMVAKPFAQRTMAVLAEFHCGFDKTRIGLGRKKTRGDICQLIATHRGQHMNCMARLSADGTACDVATVITHQDLKSAGERFPHASDAARAAFWRRLSTYAFALSPAGFGVDTHRTWEILHLGAVPIVLRSPLQALHKQFPIVIVDKWSDVFVPGALERFKNDILARFPGFATFGANASDVTWIRLTAQHWVDLVRAEQQRILVGGAAAAADSRAALVNTFIR